MEMTESYKRFLHNLLNLYSSSERIQTINENCINFSKTSEEVVKDFYDFLHLYLESELRKINSSPTILEAKMKKASLDEWLKNHIPDKRDREQIYESLVIKEHKSIFYDLETLLSLKKPKEDFIVSELIRKGELLMLAAAPKTGKSLLVTNLAMAVVTGNNFLNRKTYPTNVLFINNEENPLEVGKRVYYQGLQELEASNKEKFQELVKSEKFTLCKYLDIVQDYEDLLKVIEEKKIGLIIIDSLGASIKKSGLTEYSTELLPYLYSLQEDVCHKLNISCVLLHHTTKMDKSGGDKTAMLHGISGGSFLTRANDGYWKLMAGQKEASGTLALTCVPRNDREKVFVLAIEEEEACKWEFQVLKESSIPEEEVSIQNEILYNMKASYDLWVNEGKKEEEVYGFNLHELLEMTGCDRGILVKIINRMLQSEGIERYIKDKKHIYHYPESGESWLDIYLERDRERLEQEKQLEKLKEKVLSAVSPILSSNERMDYVSCIDNLKSEMPNGFSIINCLSADDKDRVLSYYYNSKYKKGEKVFYKGNECEIIKVVYTPSSSEDKFIYLLREYPDIFVTFLDLDN